MTKTADSSDAKVETTAQPAAGGRKLPPDDLTLRARPRPVTRLSRKAVIGITGVGSVVMIGAMFYAIDPPRLLGERDRQELYNVANKPTAKGLEGLPQSYQDIPPKLGPPLPGDLGSAILKTEQAAGIDDPGVPKAGVLPFRSDPLSDAERARRLRRAQQAQQAREGDVFFQLSQRAVVATRRQEGQQTSSGGLDAALAAAQSGPSNHGEAAMPQTQGLQDRRIAFLNQRLDSETQNSYPLIDPVSPFQVMAGTVIAASLVTGINSDLPGDIIAKVTGNVYDTVSGRHLLIPQGARLIGHYDSLVAFGQDRVLVVWHRLVMPDGSSIVLDSLPGTDTSGYAGLEDAVDFHTWRLIQGVALATLIGVSSELTFGDNTDDLVSALRESAQDTGNQTGQRFVDRLLNVQPTITIRPGWPLRVIVNKDLVLRPYRG